MERTTHNRLGVGSNPTAPIPFGLARMVLVVIGTGSHPPRADNWRNKKDVLRGDDGHNNGLVHFLELIIRLGRLNTSPQPVCIKIIFYFVYKNFIFS